VTHFFDLMDSASSPAGTCWAALFYGAKIQAPIFLGVKLE